MSKVAPKKAPPKQVVEASSEESSEQEAPVQKVQPTKKDKINAKNQEKQAQTAINKPAPKKVQAPESSEEEDTPPAQPKKAVQAPKKGTPAPVAKKPKEPTEES